MAGTHEHAAFLGHQRKHVSGPHKIGRTHVAIGERADGVGALLGGYPCGQSRTGIDGDRKGGTERRIVARHHRFEMQPPRFILRQRRADDAGRMPDDEGHLLGRA